MTRSFADQSSAGRSFACCVPSALAVIVTLLVVVIAPSFSAFSAPQNHAYAKAPFVGATTAVILFVAPAPVVTFAASDFCAVPPP